MRKCKILVPVGCRSDEGLSKPIIKRLKEDDSFNPVHIPRLNPAVFYGSYGHIEQIIWDVKPDLIFITGDRIEMCAAACAAFHNNVPIAHYFAGVVNYPLSTLDDINRHCISLWSEIQFVESDKCNNNLYRLFKSIKKTPNIHVVGITHMEDFELDESLVPEEEYDLVLINPTTLINEVQMFLSDKKTIIIGPNPDIPKDPHAIYFGKNCNYKNLPRPQFLGLLKNCTRFITNSSSAIYEAPSFLDKDQIIMIGDRNKNRTQFEYKKLDKLASEKIVEILKIWWRKKCVID